jgi:glycosyltransferase involved in cell wall biosynthesis
MRILYLAPSPGLTLNQNGGAGTHMRETIASLRKQGHEVLPIIGGDELQADQAGAEPSQGRRIIRRFVPKYFRSLRRDIIEIQHDRKLFKEILPPVVDFKPDIIYERSAYLHLVGVKIAEYLNIPRILEWGGTLVKWRKDSYGCALRFLANRVENRKNTTAHGIAAMGGVSRNYLISLSIPADKIMITGNGIDPGKFDEGSTNGSAIREKYGLNNTLIVGFVGVFRAWQGVDVLLESIRPISASIPNVHFLLVGYGMLQEQYEEYLKNQNLSNYVTITGEVPFDDIPNYIAAMDVTVMPNYMELICPVKIFEYAAMGKAAVAPRLPVIEEVIQHGKDGILITPGSCQELTDAVIQLLSDEEYRVTIGKSLQTKVLNNYTWDIIGKKTVELMEKVLQEYYKSS